MRTIRWQIFQSGLEDFTDNREGHISANTRTHFSGLRFGTPCESGIRIEEALQEFWEFSQKKKKEQNLDPDDREYSEILKKTQEENKKDPWHQPCHAKDGSSQNHESDAEQWQSKGFQNNVWLYSGILINPQGNEWNVLYSQNMKIALQEMDFFFDTLPFDAQVYPRCHKAMKIPDAKVAVEKKWKKIQTIPAWQLDKVKCKKSRLFWKHKETKQVFFATLMDMCRFKKCGV